MRNHLKELAFSDTVPHFSLVMSWHSVQARENKGTERENPGHWLGYVDLASVIFSLGRKHCGLLMYFLLTDVSLISKEPVSLLLVITLILLTGDQG